MRSLFFAIAIAAAFSSPVFAANKDALKNTKQELKASEEKQRSLAEQQAKLAKELRALQTQLVRAAEEIQKNERALAAASEKLESTKAALAEKEEQIEKNKSRLEALVNVALRFSQMPPEAMVMMPDTTGQTLRVSKALAMLSKDIKEETLALARQKQELEQLQRVLETQKKTREEWHAALQQKRGQLETRLNERERLQTALKKDQEKEAKRAEELAGKAKNLQDLLKELVKDDKLEADLSPAPASASRGKLRSFTKAKGKIRLPATGSLTSAYGTDNKAGGLNRGITLATPAEAQVIAPYDGEVIFAGAFLNYGRMAILRHSDDFHTLLAGLKRLDIENGEFLLEGEPIGAMGSSKAQRSLYIELRKDNQPVNPKPWIKGLK